MEQLIWAKTILSVYKHLERATYAIDGVVTKLSLIPELSVNELTTKIINLTDRKVNLINLKLIVEQLLSKCSSKHIRVLSLKYVQELSASEIAEVMNLNARTIFRLQNSALQQFTENMKSSGFNANYLFNHLKKEKWILSQFSKEYIKSRIIDEKIDAQKKKVKLPDCSKNNFLINQFRKSLS